METTKYTEIRGGIKLQFENEIIIDIKKVRKNWTKREFFRILLDGKIISKTLFARLYDAKRYARNYIKTIA